MSRIDGIRSLAALRSRATKIDLCGHALWVADLEDIIKSRRQRAVHAIGRCWKSWRRRSMKRRKLTKREAFERESDRVLRARIRRLLAKPPAERTHFLRKRIGFTASCL